MVVIGEIAGVYGVKGWLRIRSHTQPLENIFRYQEWQLGKDGSWSAVSVTEGRRHGRGLVAKLAGIDDRDAAAKHQGKLIAVRRDQLPDSAGDYYWTDLEGLNVETREGVKLGVVDHLLETGANDVLVVKGEKERLIPFVLDQVVCDIDLRSGVMVVNWDPDF
ncbi:MAG: ribosome maturation factor RimM [Gammaproteobacteria bacterium]|nr:ribosome maturation factor RimM [Gammaproteobacteria bacterium]